MARDDDWRAKREREEEKEQEWENAKSKKQDGGSSTLGGGRPQIPDGGSEKLDELIERGEPLIEQVNNLYNQYFSGAERLPPVERRKQLDQLMQTIQLMAKPTAGIRFKCEALLNQYNTYKDRWERMLRDLESGKIRRAGGR